MFWSSISLPHPLFSSSPHSLKDQILCAGNVQGKEHFQNLCPQVNRLTSTSWQHFMGKESEKKNKPLCVHSFPVAPSQAFPIPHCATYPTQPPPSTHHLHLLPHLLPVTPLPKFSDSLDLSMCIFPALPLSTPSCTHSACLYCCHSPIPPPAFAHKHYATQSRMHCPLSCPSIYFCAHKMAIHGDLLLHLPLQ